MKILILIKKWEGGVGGSAKEIKKELENNDSLVNILVREEDLKINSLVKSVFPIRKKVKDIMKKENYDIIYTQDWSMAFPLLFPFPIYNQKHYSCFRGNEESFLSKALQNFVGYFLKRNLVVVGDSLKKRFPKSKLIYNGVDLKKFRPLNKERIYLGWVEKEIELVKKREIINLAKKLKLKPLIAENFNIPNEKMNDKFYNKCEVFVSLPPKGAGFNKVWTEAMASGVPIIIGNKEGIGKRLSIDKVGGIEDVEEAVKNAKKKDYRKEIRRLGLTWEDNVNKLLKLWGHKF